LTGGLAGGIKPGFIFYVSKAPQSKPLNHTCCLTSSGPFSPNLFAGFLYINLFIKSAASIDHPSGISFILIYTYSLSTLSLISFLSFPLYGLLPNINS